MSALPMRDVPRTPDANRLIKTILIILSVLCALNLCALDVRQTSKLIIDPEDEKWINSVDDDSFFYKPPLPGTRNTPRYVAIAPRYVRPGQAYRVVVSVLSADHSLMVRASLHRDEREQVASANQRIVPGRTETLVMRVPVTAHNGAYRLRLEGNTNGGLGGSAFCNESDVIFSQRFLTILIQTNQLVFNHRQPIYIRVILLTTRMKPYNDPCDVYLIDSRGLIMKRWYSVYPYLGFLSVHFHLPSDYPSGWWTVRVTVLGQVEEKKIKLERWFGDRFDVNVTLPGYVVSSREFLDGAVRANHTNFSPVYGNLTIRAVIKPFADQRINREGTTRRVKYKYLERNIFRFSGTYEFRFAMEELKNLALPNRLQDCVVEVRAYVGERYMNLVVKGYARTRVFDKAVNLRFVGITPQIFKPGMPFKTRLAVTYFDQVPLEAERLETARIRFELVTSSQGGGQTVQDDPVELRELAFDDNGVLEIKFDTFPKTEKIKIRAHYWDDSDRADAEMTAHAFYSEGNHYLHIYTSTKSGQAGEYAIFHVWANFYLKMFNYLVVSKGIILLSGLRKVNGIRHSVTTFAIPVSPEMAPSCQVIVYHAVEDGEVVADSVSLPVQGINRIPFSLRINDKQDRTGSLIELVPGFTPEAIIGISAVDVDSLSSQGKADLTPNSVLDSMYEFDEGRSKTQRIVWLDREGGPEKTEHYVTQNYGRDANRTFDVNGLVILTNMKLGSFPNYCNDSNGMLPCVSGQCYRFDKHCDGFKDCEDGTDEGNCPMPRNETEQLDYYLSRTNRQYQFYESCGLDFAWQDILMGDQTEQYSPCYPPKRPTVWRLNAIAMSKTYGFAILEEPIYVDGTNPFFITVEAPRTAVIGEQIGLRVVLFNYQLFEIKAEVVLEDSPDYKFVQVESFGIVKSYNPRTSFGEHQHLLYVKPHSQRVVYVPIVATTTGVITVGVTGRTQIATDSMNIDINVLADGVPVFQHTSMLLDMRSQAYNLKFLNLNVSDDPIIPFEDTYRRFMFDSPKVRVSIIGDVVGAPVGSDPVDTSELRMARPVKSGEHMMFNFAYNLHTLNYLRLTNQLNATTQKTLLEYLNRGYVYQSVFFVNGSFTMFRKQPSVWLTAFCARIYNLAQYPGWEQQLYIDPKMIADSVRFLLENQTPEGSFAETTLNPWNKKMASKITSDSRYYHYKNVTLTAHVLITLTKVTDLVGDLRSLASNARAKAKNYLERQLASLRDPYELAIVTYALMEAGSVEAESGFYKLDRLQRSSEGMIYWSPGEIPAPQIIYQSQRPFIQPRNPSKYDSVAVEATAYALMIYSRNGGVVQDRIVQFLNTMRFTDPAFVSTQDTIVAMEALVDYSFRSHIRDITAMRLDVHISANPNKTYSMSISPENLAEKRSITARKNVWGHVEVQARGSGLAILQVDLEYNVDRDFLLIPPPEDAFDLTIDYAYHGRNKSHYNIKACARWKLLKESESSGLAVIEVALPTGYLTQKLRMNALVQDEEVPRLQRARVLPRSAVFMFDYLDREWSCVNFTVERWYPVANMTRYLKARVYDYYMPERYKEVIFEDYELYVLNICEVCGSYQCPYCPHFSWAAKPSVQWLLIVATLLLSLITQRWTDQR